eukprot:UN06153
MLYRHSYYTDVADTENKYSISFVGHQNQQTINNKNYLTPRNLVSKNDIQQQLNNNTGSSLYNLNNSVNDVSSPYPNDNTHLGNTPL